MDVILMNDMIKQIVQCESIEMLESKGLYDNNDFNDRFYFLYKNYKILFEKYLLSKLPLVEYDNMIDESKLLISPVNMDNMDIYQLLSTFNLKYIFLRNILNVDKLSIEDIELIVNLKDEELSNPRETLYELIDKTYKLVLDANRDETDGTHMVCYGEDRDYFWYDSRELVFGIRQDEFFDNGLDRNEEWFDNYVKQMQFLGKIIEELQNKCSEILGIKVNFLYYDDVSVIKSMSR